MTNAEAIKVLLNEWKCIDRNDGINCNRKCESCDLVMDSAVLKDAYNLAIKALEAQEWIPVSKRLPEDSGRYLISVLDGIGRRTTVTSYQKRYKAWVMTGRMAYWKVLAWKPLPEPYREEDTNVNVKS
jgi:hypothetical protein